LLTEVHETECFFFVIMFFKLQRVTIRCSGV